MKNITEPYQLPSIYKKEKGKHRHRIFVFLKTTDAAIQAVAAEAAMCEKLEMLQLWFEMGITETDVQRYLDILKSALPAEREIEIVHETDIPKHLIQQWYKYAHSEIVKRRALLN